MVERKGAPPARAGPRELVQNVDGLPNRLLGHALERCVTVAVDARTCDELARHQTARQHYTWLRAKMRLVLTTVESSRRNAIVMAQQSTEESLAADSADLLRGVEH